jgi:RNase H-fold protein (predicted Holliday junction resolvase)
MAVTNQQLSEQQNATFQAINELNLKLDEAKVVLGFPQEVVYGIDRNLDQIKLLVGNLAERMSELEKTSRLTGQNLDRHLGLGAGDRTETIRVLQNLDERLNLIEVNGVSNKPTLRQRIDTLVESIMGTKSAR